MKRIAIIPFLILLLFAACKEDYIGTIPVAPASSGAIPGTIVYTTTDNAISTIDPEGGNHQIAVPAGNTAYRALLDAVGGRIFYSDWPEIEGGTEIISVVEAGAVTKILRVSHDTANASRALSSPVVFPDGKRILVISAGPLNNDPSLARGIPYINIVRTDQGEFPAVASVPLPITGDILGSLSASVSPDGRTVAFIYCAAKNGYRNMLATIGTDGTNMRDLDGCGPLQTPCWSPDGSRLAVFGGDYPNGLTIYDAASGGKIGPMRTDAGAVSSVIWSPKGTRFGVLGSFSLFPASPDYRQQIKVFDMNGIVTGTVDFDYQQALNTYGNTDSVGWVGYQFDWSPDDTHLLFLGQADPHRKEQDLYVTEIGGKNQLLVKDIVTATWMR